jgi:hypothetical protein
MGNRKRRVLFMSMSLSYWKKKATPAVNARYSVLRWSDTIAV